MARRPTRRRVVGLTFLLTLSSCTFGTADVATTTTRVATTSTSSNTTTSSSTTTTTTTTSTTTTTTTMPTTTTTVELPQIDAEVGIPDGDGPFPAVVLVHGGGWVGGDPSLMRGLARRLNAEGFLTVNTRYQLTTLEQPGFPRAIDDVACAVRYAAAHPQSDGTVAVIGHSAGAHIAAVVALTGDDYTDHCSLTEGGLPDKLVGLAGPYDISRFGPVMALFFGATEDQDPEAWRAGNPQRLTDENPGLTALIMYGELDGLVQPSFAVDFHQALVDSGADSTLELVEGARHNDMYEPAFVGDLIVTWMERQPAATSG